MSPKHSKGYFLPLCMLFVVLTTTAVAHSKSYPIGADNWTIAGQEVEFVEYRGQRALRLKGGSAILNDVELIDGVLEFDIAASALRTFCGARFRVVDDSNFEHFYIRPHQSGNPDANQYTPVFAGVSGWQLYYGEGYAAPSVYTLDDWMHIKIVFQGSRAEIYVNSDEPTILVRQLKRTAQSGQVGIDASPLASTYFANVTVTPIPDNYTFAELPAEQDASSGTVSSWQVSDAFSRAAIKSMSVLSEEFKTARHWTRLAAESTGITNFARLRGISESHDTAVGRLSIRSESAQFKGLSFGYSDDVSVYVNGTRIYSGSNSYISRDYRYLGTIGQFDKVYLPLQAGQNEVWFAVSEAFGGWGIQAKFDNFDGITLTDR